MIFAKKKDGLNYRLSLYMEQDSKIIFHVFSYLETRCKFIHTYVMCKSRKRTVRGGKVKEKTKQRDEMCDPRKSRRDQPRISKREDEEA